MTTLNFTRVLTLEKQGTKQEIRFEIIALERMDSLDSWKCTWAIEKIHPEVGHTYGRDPIDALQIAFTFVGKLLSHLEEEGYSICWQFEGDHCGLGSKYLEML